MKRRQFIGSLICASVLPAIANATGTDSRKADERPLILDGMGEIWPHYPIELIDEVIDSGTNAVCITLGHPTSPLDEAFMNGLESLAEFERHIDLHRDRFLKVTCVADIDRAREEKRLGLLYMFQNTTHIQDDFSKLELFYNLGLRGLQLTYNLRNSVGCGCHEKQDTGLTSFGRDLVERLNEMGILVDLSHAGSQTAFDALAAATKPPVISHSACLSVYEHPRNVSDDILRALADRGGVVGIYQLNPYISPGGLETTLDSYFAHIDHAVKVAGIDHVGIGSDREHRRIENSPEEIRKLEEEMAPLLPEGSPPIKWPFYLKALNHPRRMETVLQGLDRRGYKTAEIEKIMGLNFYRLYRETIG